MNCSACDHDNPIDARFCSACGVPLRLRCDDCGRENDGDAQFCNGCGTPVGDASASRGTPRDYTPRHLADRILKQRSVLEGERKQVTILFADVKGSLELAGQIDPEGWHRVLDRFFAILADGVHRFEGTVNQYTGDGIMALFGAPIAHEDHAQRACWAALHLKRELREYALQVKREHGLGFSTRMGVHSGEVVVGKIGDDLRMDYTAQGQAVGLAARMESLAEPNSIYATEETARLVESFFTFESMGRFDVKGIPDPVNVQELIGLGEARTRFERSRVRGLSRFVGRGADTATLEAALQTAREGRGQVVGVVGEAGVGKSRLCFEFLESCRRQGVPVYRGSAVSHGSNLPAHPMMQVFREYFGLAEGDDARAIREKLVGRILLLDPGLQEELPLVFDFFGVADPARPAPPVDPDVRQRRTRDVLRRVIQSEETTVTLIEDLHWFDPASEQFLADWVDAIPGARSLLVLNFRPEYAAPWMRRSSYHQLALAPLGPEAMRELLEGLLGHDASLGDLSGTIAERTAGSPLFCEEIVRELVETGVLEGTRGTYRLSKPVESIAVPQTVQPLLAARIDRLSEFDKSVLQTASVIGKEFGEDLLARVLEPGESLRGALGRLKEAEFVYEASLFPTIEYAFRHPLTQEVAYSTQLAEHRARQHAAVADHLAVADDTAGAALLAYHREAAGDVLRAAQAYCRAGETGIFATPSEMVPFFRKVRELLAGEMRGDARDLQKRAILGLFHGGGYRFGVGGDEVEALYAEGKRLGEEDGDAYYLAALLLVYTPILGIVRSDLAPYIQAAAECDRHAEQSGALELQVGAKQILYYSAVLDDRLEDAYAAANDLVRIAGDDHRVGMSFTGLSGAASGRWSCALIVAPMGRLDEAKGLLLDAEAIAREIGSAQDLCYALGGWASLAELSGEAADAEPRVRESVELAEKSCSPFVANNTWLALARVLMVRARWEEAMDCVDRAEHTAHEVGTSMEDESTRRVFRARCLFELGDLNDLNRAARLIEEAIALMDAGRAARFQTSRAKTLHGLILGRQGDPSAGDAVIQNAIARELPGYRLLGLIDRARLGNEAGWPNVARESLEEAVGLARKLGARGHLAAGERGLEALGASGDGTDKPGASEPSRSTRRGDGRNRP